MKNTAFIPKYQHLFDIFCQKIRNGNLKYGDKLPTIRELAQQYSVSLITTRTAVRELQKAGLVRCVRKSGTIVIWRKENEYYEVRKPRENSKTVSVVHALLNPSPLHEYMLQQFADRFMYHNSHINVSFVKLDPSGVKDPYLQLIADGTPPSCGEFFWHARYARENALYPLEQFEDFPDLQKELLPGSFYQTTDGNNESHIHAVYFYHDLPTFVALNTESFKKIPTAMTWARIRRIIQQDMQTAQSGFYTSALTIPYSYHGVKIYIELLGQDLFHKGIQINSPEKFYRIFETESAYIGLEHLRNIVNCKNIRTKNSHDFFALGLVKILPFANAWTLNLLNILNNNFKYQFYKMPPIGDYCHYSPFSSGFSIGIFQKGIKSDAQLYAAWEWLRFFFHERTQYFLSQDLKLPVKKGVEPLLAKKKALTYNLTKQLLTHSVPQPDFVGMRIFYTIAGERIASFINNKTTPEVCLKEIRKSLKKKLH